MIFFLFINFLNLLARELQSIAILKLFENEAITKDGEYDLKCFAISSQMDNNILQIISNFGFNYIFTVYSLSKKNIF